MLVLTRHVHQSIVIGHDVVVTVLEVRGDQVRLGITAPKDVQVHREEVFVALTTANRQAATSSNDLGVLSELVAGKQPAPGGAGAGADNQAGATGDRPRSEQAGTGRDGARHDVDRHDGGRHDGARRLPPPPGPRPRSSAPSDLRPSPPPVAEGPSGQERALGRGAEETR